MRENETCLDQGWNQLPTEELDQVLQAELEKDRPNEEVVLPILHELEEREKDYPVETTPEVLTILDQFSKHETASKQSRNRHRWIIGIAAVAASICIVIMAIPRTVGAHSIFDVLFRWTESIFEFFTPGQDVNNPPVDVIFSAENPGLQQLYDKVTELGIEMPVVPMWLPEGFVLSELKEIPMAGGTKVLGKFEQNDLNILISYRISSKIATKFEKEDISFEVYDFADVSHFILENDKNISVTWTLDGIECSILADIDKENVYAIIKSIYRRSM